VEDLFPGVYLKCFFDKARDCHQQTDKSVNYWALGFYSAQYAVKEFVEKHWHSQKHGYFAFFELFEHERCYQFFTENNFSPRADGFDENRQHGVNMVNGKDSIENVGVINIQRGSLGQKTVGYQILVGQHYSLWIPCGPGCEKYGSKIVFRSFFNWSFRTVQIVNILPYAFFK